MTTPLYYSSNQLMKYYLWMNEHQEGPYEDWEILKKLTAGSITLDTLSCEEGASQPKWVKVSEIPSIRYSSKYAPEKRAAFQSSISFFSIWFARVYLFVGFVIAIGLLVFGDPASAIIVFFSSIAIAIFYEALGELIRILNDIRSDLKNSTRG